MIDMYNKNYIDEKTKVHTEILDEIDSTNEEAKRRIKEGASDDFVLVARKQTAGKGRKGRSFYSPKDTGIYLTFTYFTDDSAENVLKVTVATSVIAAKAIKDALNIDCGIKWVNDLYYNGKKVSGTLCEFIFKGTYGNNRNAVIVGIGINLSTDDFPEEISSKAGALISADNDYSCFDDIVIGISNGLNSFFENCDLGAYLPLYKKLSVVIGNEVELSDASGVVDKGTVYGFDENGAIYIKNPSGYINKYDSGEISLCML